MDKATLRQYTNVIKEIEQLEAERENILAGLQGAVQHDGMPHGQNVADPVGNAGVKLAELKTLLDAKVDELIGIRLAIESVIETLPPEERRLMRLRYIEGRRWEQIAVEMNYSYRRVTQIHGNILLSIADK